MGEVEAEPSRLDQRARLVSVASENLPQCPMEDMGAGVRFPDSLPPGAVDREVGGLAHLDVAGGNFGSVPVEALQGMPGVEDRQGSGFGGDRTGVTDLAAGFGIERGDVDEDLDLLAMLGPLDHLAVAHDRQDPAGAGLGFVSGEHGRSGLVDDAPVKLAGHRRIATSPRFPGSAALALHLLVEAGPVDLDAALVGDLGGELDWEAKRVVKLEGHRTGESCPFPRVRRRATDGPTRGFDGTGLPRVPPRT